MSWYQLGSTEESRQKAKEEPRKRIPTRFWLNPREKKRLIIVDDIEFSLWEHQVIIPGAPNKWGNFETCVAGMDGTTPCPLCLARNRRMFRAYITVVDTTGYPRKKDGKIIKYSRYLFPMTVADLDKFVALRTRNTSLVGAILDVERTGDSAARLGDLWDIVPFSDEQKINPKILEDEKLFYKSQRDGKLYPPEPFDYLNIFEPKTAAELRELAATSSEQTESFKGSGSYAPPDGGDDDVLY